MGGGEFRAVQSVFVDDGVRRIDFDFGIRPDPPEVEATGPTRDAALAALRRIIAGGCKTLKNKTRQRVISCMARGEPRVTEIKLSSNPIVRFWRWMHQPL